MKIFQVFKEFEQKIFQLSAKKWSNYDGSALYVPREAIWRNQRFFKKANCVFFVFWDIEPEVIVVSSEKHRYGCQNWILTLHRSILRIYCWKIFCVSSDLSRKLSKFQLKRWNKSVGIELFLSTRIIWEKLEFLKKNKLSLFCFLNSSQTLWVFEIKASPGVSNLLSIFPDENFEEKILNNFYVSYRVLSGNFSNFWLKVLGKPVGTASNVPRRIIWRKQFCSGKKIFYISRILHEKYLDFGHKNIGLVVKTEIQLVTNNVRGLIFHRFFVFFSNIRRKFFGLVVHFLGQHSRNGMVTIQRKILLKSVRRKFSFLSDNELKF